MNLAGVEDNVRSVGIHGRLLKSLEHPQEMNTQTTKKAATLTDSSVATVLSRPAAPLQVAKVLVNKQPAAATDTAL